MGLFNFIKGEFIEVVHWEDDSQDTMVYKFPMVDKQQIKEGAQLIVRPSQIAIFVYEGQIADVYQPGKYALHTDTMPIFTSLSNWKFRFENHFKTDVYFVNTKQFTNQKWGTSNPIMMRDKEFGILRLRGFGVYAFKVLDAVAFLKEVFGSNKFYKVDQITEHLKSLIVSSISDVLAESTIPAIDLATQYDEIGSFAMTRINDRFNVFGLTITDFAIENISLPESVEEAIDKRTQMGAIGNMQNYMQYQTAEAIRDAAQNPSGGMASMGAGLGAGMGIGKMMNEMMQPTSNAPSSAEGVNCPNCNAMMPKDAKFCSECGTNFSKTCVSCQKAIPVNSKFCSECGAAQSSEKLCPKCGEKNDASSKFCKSCGEKL